MKSPHHVYAQVKNNSEESVIIDRNEDSPIGENFHVIHGIRFSVPKCSMCKENMEFSEGEVIFGDKWYHELCWEKNQKNTEF